MHGALRVHSVHNCASASAYNLGLLDTALLQWLSEYAVRAYTTVDSAVSYLNFKPRSDRIDYTSSFAL